MMPPSVKQKETEGRGGRRYSPMTWTEISRRRGPSNSAKMIDWKRPSVSSPGGGGGVAPPRVDPPGVGGGVAAALGEEPLGQRLEVLDQRALELVDEERARGVQRVDQGDARGDGELLDRVPPELGDIGDLGALLTRQRERGAEDLHVVLSPGRITLDSLARASARLRRDQPIP